jgi:hypothetical protein
LRSRPTVSRRRRASSRRRTSLPSQCPSAMLKRHRQCLRASGLCERNKGLCPTVHLPRARVHAPCSAVSATVSGATPSAPLHAVFASTEAISFRVYQPRSANVRGILVMPERLESG